MREIPFRDFAAMCRKRGIDKACLIDRFPKLIERGGMVPDSTEAFCDRIFSAQFANVVIPYRPLIEFYIGEVQSEADHRREKKYCVCGCGRLVLTGRRWASDTCRKRNYRKRQDGLLTADSAPVEG